MNLVICLCVCVCVCVCVRERERERERDDQWPNLMTSLKSETRKVVVLFYCSTSIVWLLVFLNKMDRIPLLLWCLTFSSYGYKCLYIFLCCYMNWNKVLTLCFNVIVWSLVWIHWQLDKGNFFVWLEWSAMWNF